MGAGDPRTLSQMGAGDPGELSQMGAGDPRTLSRIGCSGDGAGEDVDEDREVLHLAMAVGEVELAGLAGLVVAQPDGVGGTQHADIEAVGDELVDVLRQVASGPAGLAHQRTDEHPQQGRSRRRRPVGDVDGFLGGAAP